MNVRYLFLTVFLTICFSATAQKNDFQQEVINYLTTNGTVKQYESVFDDMFVVIKQQFSGANIPETEWANLKNSKSKDVDMAIRMFASAYRKHFTQDQIIAMNNFFGTPAGVQMRINPEALNADQRKEVKAFYDSEAGQNLNSVSGELTTDVSQISEYWSRDLFNEKMNALIAKGYSPQ
ncbi:hypothetical protein ULMS_28380 [Patiriisocius marinistellae]|uniref:DUF2059 domain-containing protein n=1 Tax=Patiriisocius marinistellae TaxID=2494560 RepID=A0A5J4FYJ2_9FLAO|nr:DUF2059 domain-containing protein [Patiriisocius marinistellae]GEQ87330.1 hypothetical protein ULMS_28380 [Patiriisocius marinistellae]